MQQPEVVVTIKSTESELNCIIWALTAIKTIRLPIDPKWKIPYNALLKEMRMIRDELIEVKRDKINDQKEEPTSSFDVDVQKEIQMSQGTYVAGCKGDDCD
jgi:hypothetical protein